MNSPRKVSSNQTALLLTSLSFSRSALGSNWGYERSYCFCTSLGVCEQAQATSNLPRQIQPLCCAWSYAFALDAISPRIPIQTYWNESQPASLFQNQSQREGDWWNFAVALYFSQISDFGRDNYYQAHQSSKNYVYLIVQSLKLASIFFAGCKKKRCQHTSCVGVGKMY